MENRLLDCAKNAVKAGGAILKEKRFEQLKIIRKEDGDLASSFDFETEAVIKSILRSKFPDSLIYAEESTEEVSCNEDGNIIWYVDSLDGTKAFLRGNVAFVSVSVAALDKGGLICGVIYNPFTKLIYQVTRSSTVGKINDQEIIQVVRPPLNQARILLDISSELPNELKKELLLAEMNRIGRVFRYDGSIAQHLCLIAQGILDGAIFWGPGNKGAYWDLAAAQLLCEKSNLLVTDFKGNRITQQTEVFDQVIVAPTEFHQDILDWIGELKSKFKLE